MWIHRKLLSEPTVPALASLRSQAAQNALFKAEKDCVRYVISEGDVVNCRNPGAVGSLAPSV